MAVEGALAALPVFRGQGQGHLVTTVSTAGLKIVPTQAVYAPTKNAVRTLLEGPGLTPARRPGPAGTRGRPR